MATRAFAHKDPDETDFFNIDFSDRIPSTDAIASIVTVFVVEDGDDALEIDSFAFSGLVVSGRWQGGTLDATYTITARVLTEDGRTLNKSGTVLVAQT